MKHLAKRSSTTVWLNALALSAAGLAVASVGWKNFQPASAPKAGVHPTVKAANLPDASQALSSIVFVVRKGNPKSIRDWPDLVRKDVTVIPPDPKTSVDGKLGVFAAWGSVVHRGGSESSALTYLKQLYSHASAKLGDVHLAWEDEAILEAKQSQGDCEIVYPPLSIRAQPFTAWVDPVVSRRHTDASAEAYLQFLFSTPAPPAAVLRNSGNKSTAMHLFPVTVVAKNWRDAETKFFAKNGILDQMYPLATLSLAARN